MMCRDTVRRANLAHGIGMSCEAGRIVSDTYAGIAQILSILGNVGGSTEMSGRATGVLQGACHN